jgi:hypothetical protein
MIADLQNEFEAQKYPLNFMKNGPMGTLLILRAYKPERDAYAPDIYVSFQMQSSCRNDCRPQE